MGETIELRPSVPARERILDTAYDLFSRRGVRGVGVDEVIERAAVAKATLYRHFSSKDELVHRLPGAARAGLDPRACRGRRAQPRASTPEECAARHLRRLRRVVPRGRFRGCSFINVMLETADLQQPVGQASIVHLENIRRSFARSPTEAGLRDPDAFARTWHILMKGSIVSAAEGDLEAAKRAQAIGRLVLAQHRS